MQQAEDGVPGEELRDVMMQFESLGSNCEFGIAQRFYKAEPIGLLRWAFAKLPDVLSGLESRFDGIGQADSIVIKRTPRKEYMVEEARFHYLYHSFVFEHEMSEEDLRKRETRRLAYLGGKLIEDLEAGEKIFVIKRNQPIERPEAKKLLRRLRTFNPGNRLLWVTLPTPRDDAGTVRWADDGLMRGFLSRFADPLRVMHTTPSEEWGVICRKALALCAGPAAGSDAA